MGITPGSGQRPPRLIFTRSCIRIHNPSGFCFSSRGQLRATRVQFSASARLAPRLLCRRSVLATVRDGLTGELRDEEEDSLTEDLAHKIDPFLLPNEGENNEK